MVGIRGQKGKRGEEDKGGKNWGFLFQLISVLTKYNETHKSTLCISSGIVLSKYRQVLS